MTQDNGLDLPWEEEAAERDENCSFAFDLETTDANSATCTPVQICLVADQGGARRILLNTYVRPGEAISPEAMEVHRITDAIAATGPDYAMAAWQANLLNREMRPKYLVGFNSISFDEPIINRCLGSKVFEGTQHIDVLNVAYRFFPELPSHKLGALYETFFNKPLAGAHDASVDVFGTLDLLHAMRTKIGMTMAQLGEEMKTPKVYSVMPIGKYRGKTPDTVDPGWARWMKKNATDMRPDLQRTVDYILTGK